MNERGKNVLQLEINTICTVYKSILLFYFSSSRQTCFKYAAGGNEKGLAFFCFLNIWQLEFCKLIKTHLKHVRRTNYFAIKSFVVKSLW